VLDPTVAAVEAPRVVPVLIPVDTPVVAATPVELKVAPLAVVKDPVVAVTELKLEPAVVDTTAVVAEVVVG